MAETVAQKMKKVAEASRAQKADSTSSEKPNLDSSTETLTESGSEAPAVVFTPELLAEQEQMLRSAIDLGVSWFEEAQDAEAFEAMSVKEQRFSQLLDPLIWSMREALITFEHGDCEDCKVRRETGGNGYGLAVADMLLGGKVNA